MSDINNLFEWGIIIFIALIFSIITIIYYYKKDKYEPEPWRRIFLAVTLGVLSSIPALLFSYLALLLFDPDAASTSFILAVVVAPIIEEAVKGWIVITLAKNRNFDGPLDGIIYGAFVGTGFALAENSLYGITSLINSGFIVGLGVTSFRGLVQIIGHPLYTGLFGAGVGAYKVGMQTTQTAKIYRSVFLHSLWNFTSVIFPIALVLPIIYGIYILRREIKMAVQLDEIAVNEGYYSAKQRYFELYDRLKERM